MRELVIYLNRIIIRLVPLALIIVFVIGVIGPVPARADPGWYDTDWQYRKKITINSANVSGSTNLTDFPVLISVVDSDLIGKTMSNGDDIIFTAGDEVTRLSHEIESYNGTSGDLNAWVRIPSLSPTTNTDIYMYYDNNGVGNSENATDVWDSNFKMVQHLDETSGTHYDSTIESNDGTPNMTPSSNQDATGKINGSDEFDGSDDYIDCGDDITLQIKTDLTVEVWAKRDIVDAYQTLASKNSFNGKRAWFIRLENNAGNNKIRFYLSKDGTGSQLLDSDTAINDTGWHHIAATYHYVNDGTSQVRIYVDGSLDKSDNTFLGDIYGESPVDVLIGALYSSSDSINNVHDGLIDEVRISDNARTADWIETSYNNQSSPSIFLSFDTEESAPSTPSVTTSPAAPVEEDTATLNGAITATGGENADTRGFEWDTDSSGPPYSSNWTEAGSFGAGPFTDNLTGLTKGELYYYRAIAHNSAGWDYGGEQTFLTKPDGPAGLTAVIHGADWVYLTWTNGTGFDSTTIRYDTTGYPGSPTSGSPGYFGSGTSANITGLNPNQLYYFRAWSYATEGGLEQWSDLSSSEFETTDSGAPVAIGGKVLIVNKAMVLAPWVLVGIGFLIVVIRLIQRLKKRLSTRSPDKDAL